MIKIFCLLAALLVSTGCKIDRPEKVRATEEKKVEPTVVNQTSSGPNSPNIVRNGGKATVTYVPGAGGGAISVSDDRTPTVYLPSGQRFMYIIPASQATELGYGSERMIVTKDIRAEGLKTGRHTIWKSGRTPHSWEAVICFQEN